MPAKADRTISRLDMEQDGGSDEETGNGVEDG